MSTLTVKQMKIRFYPVTVNAAILPNSKYYRRFLMSTLTLRSSSVQIFGRASQEVAPAIVEQILKFFFNFVSVFHLVFYSLKFLVLEYCVQKAFRH